LKRLSRFAFMLVNAHASLRQGWSPLIWACFSGQYDVGDVFQVLFGAVVAVLSPIQVVKLLLAHKADEDLMKTMPSPVKRGDDADVSDSEETEESRQGVVSPLHWAALKVRGVFLCGWTLS
jgi:ankyrin repeat protein